MDKMRRIIASTTKDVLTGGLCSVPRCDPETYNKPLSGKQWRAVALLLAGNNVTDTAKEIGVQRQTLSGWLNRNFAFNKAIEDGRELLWQSARDELLSMASEALQVIRERLRQDSLPAAMAVLRGIGLTDPQTVIAANAARQQGLASEAEKIQHAIFRRALVAECARRDARRAGDSNNPGTEGESAVRNEIPVD